MRCLWPTCSRVRSRKAIRCRGKWPVPRFESLRSCSERPGRCQIWRPWAWVEMSLLGSHWAFELNEIWSSEKGDLVM
jgi:hypothetical protein